MLSFQRTLGQFSATFSHFRKKDEVTQTSSHITSLQLRQVVHVVASPLGRAPSHCTKDSVPTDNG